jgi:glycine cleavage system H protein
MELAEILAELPEDVLYSAEHDMWVRREGEEVVVGANRFVVAHGQFMLFYPRPCEVPVMRDKSLGVMETAKTAVAIGCPVSCVIVAANEAVQNDIGVVIRDPYGAGWLYRLRPIAWDEDSMFLMSASEYREWLAQHSKERLRKPDPQHHEMPPIDPQNISY